MGGPDMLRGRNSWQVPRMKPYIRPMTISRPSTSGRRRRSPRLLATFSLASFASACGSDLRTAPAADASTPVPADTAPAFRTLSLTTPEGSGQTVHPDFVTMPSGWGFSHQYLVITPYPNGNAGYENPSIFEGTAPLTWVPPAGVTNPVAAPLHGYLSDPDAVAVPESNELWVYYREVESRNEAYVIRSADGVHFTAPRVVASAKNHDLISPSVVHRGPGDWMMWSVKAGDGCSSPSTSVELRRSTDGLDWSAPVEVSLSQAGGYFAWHIDVEWIPSRQEFWALYNGKTPGSCGTPALFLATSADGLAWKTFPSPILIRGASPELKDIVYRSTFSYDEATDAIDFWYSGARYEMGKFVWSTVYQRRARREVFSIAASRNIIPAAALAARAGVPRLLHAP
jgi:hypothetical protein